MRLHWAAIGIDMLIPGEQGLTKSTNKVIRGWAEKTEMINDQCNVGPEEPPQGFEGEEEKVSVSTKKMTPPTTSDSYTYNSINIWVEKIRIFDL